jgi:protocatechuate 4,5-dioxygenase beta chain
MAEIVLTLAVPHTPLLWRALREPVPSDLTGVAASFARFRALLAAERPDVLVVVGSDHLRSIMTSNMPAFLIGKADEIRGTLPSEQRAFGLPASIVPGHRDLAAHLLGGRQLPSGFDFSFSDEPWLDHSFMMPLLYLTPELDIPVVPIHTNTNAPPIPLASRFRALGGYLREAIATWPGPERVAVVGTGHLSFELGGPRQFSKTSLDPEFDQVVLNCLKQGDGSRLVEAATYDRMLAAGNLTFQCLNFITCLAASGETAATIAEAIPSRFGNEPFMAWGGDS